MKYIDVTWMHEFDSYPVRLVSELNAQRCETRKLEFFRNGRVGSEGTTPGTELGELPVPGLAEINSDPQFEGVEISGHEFEVLWDEYVAGT